MALPRERAVPINFESEAAELARQLRLERAVRLSETQAYHAATRHVMEENGDLRARLKAAHWSASCLRADNAVLRGLEPPPLGAKPGPDDGDAILLRQILSLAAEELHAGERAEVARRVRRAVQRILVQQAGG